MAKPKKYKILYSTRVERKYQAVFIIKDSEQKKLVIKNTADFVSLTFFTKRKTGD